MTDRLIIDKKSLRIAFWASFARLVGVGLGSGVGSIVYQLVGAGTNGWSVAIIMAFIAFNMMLFSEYERERSRN